MFKKLREVGVFISNYPFDNMPVTNGCYWSVSIPVFFGFLTGNYILYAMWFLTFCWSIILDKMINAY